MVSISSDLSSHAASAQLGGVSNADNVLSLIDALPDELMLKVYEYLEVPDLGKCQMVSRRWKLLAGDVSFEKKIQLHRIHEMLPDEGNFIDERAWKLLGDIGEVPPLPDNIFEELMKPCPFWNPKGTADGKKVKDTHVLGVMVDKVNNEPVTINSIEKYAKTPKEGGHATQYDGIWEPIREDFGETAVEKPYWALMTEDMLPGSQFQFRNDQLAMAANFGYEAPTLLQAIAYNIVRYVSTGKGIFNKDPWRCTCCQEQTGGMKSVVGGFSSSGLFVYRASNRSRNVGVAALRKF